MIWHKRAVLNLSRFSRNSDRLTGAHWKYIDNGLCSKFVTRIKDSNNMLRGYLNGVGWGGIVDKSWAHFSHSRIQM